MGKLQQSIVVAGMLFIAGTMAASSQSQNVRQSGAVTSGHGASWTTNGIIQDAGTSDVGNLTTLGITGTGTPFCISETKVRTGEYHKFCLGLDSDGNADLSINGYGGATSELTITIDGVAYPFPQPIPAPPIAATPLRNIASGTTDTATTSDANGTIAWNSASASGKTQTLPTCAFAINGMTVAIKDERGTASTYPITISSSGGSTVEGATSYYISIDGQAVSFQCNYVTNNWIAK
ncbi:MAG: hypothetical protein E6R03_07975 [Hyphomicrobiaceae bacterium]|nr:MAG: hypothetical protein E6R03_07975 [Hyphomicrobiaceae bacterium]